MGFVIEKYKEEKIIISFIEGSLAILQAVLFIVIYNMDSPKFLHHVGKIDESKESLTKIYEEETVAIDELDSIRDASEHVIFFIYISRIIPF